MNPRSVLSIDELSAILTTYLTTQRIALTGASDRVMKRLGKVEEKNPTTLDAANRLANALVEKFTNFMAVSLLRDPTDTFVTKTDLDRLAIELEEVARMTTPIFFEYGEPFARYMTNMFVHCLYTVFMGLASVVDTTGKAQWEWINGAIARATKKNVSVPVFLSRERNLNVLIREMYDRSGYRTTLLSAFGSMMKPALTIHFIIEYVEIHSHRTVGLEELKTATNDFLEDPMAKEMKDQVTAMLVEFVNERLSSIYDQ